MDEELRMKLAESGAALARIAGGMTPGAPVSPLFDAAETHILALEQAGIPQDAFATGVMTLLTAFGARFNPEDYAGRYLMLLLRMAMDAAVAQQEAAVKGDQFALEHYEAIDAEFGPLVLQTYRALGAGADIPEPLRQPFEQLEAWVDADAEFQGQRITATLAADILYDIAARLTALGVIE